MTRPTTTWYTALLAAIAVAAAAATPAGAQPAPPYDHLTCFKMRDSFGAADSKFTALASFESLQAQFGISPACRVRVKATQFCVPARKQLDDSGGAPVTDFVGQPLDNDFICYKVACPKIPEGIPDLEVEDQFGRRSLTGFKNSIQTICTPARKVEGACCFGGSPQTCMDDVVSSDCPGGWFQDARCGELDSSQCNIARGACCVPGEAPMCMDDVAINACRDVEGSFFYLRNCGDPTVQCAAN
jgi:hypothetical protein